MLSPQDPTNPLRGTATGAKVEAHYYFADEKQPIDVRLVGEYSTAFETYYAELRVGARICDKLFIGPDAEVDGDTGYNAQRLGGYAKYSFELAKGVPVGDVGRRRTSVRQRRWQRGIWRRLRHLRHARARHQFLT